MIFFEKDRAIAECVFTTDDTFEFCVEEKSFMTPSPQAIAEYAQHLINAHRIANLVNSTSQTWKTKLTSGITSTTSDKLEKMIKDLI